MRKILALLVGILAGAQALAADFDWKSRFTEGLVDADGKAVDLSTLKGKVVGVYHSAHWCGPCRAFTPQLVEFANAHKDKFAVVFVSHDRDAASMSGYMKEAKMPWSAVPFRSKSAQRNTEENGIRGIPTLVIYGKDGAVAIKNARADLGAVEKLLK